MLNPLIETSWNHGFKEPLMSFWKKRGSDMKWPFFLEFEVRFDVRFTAVFNVPGMVGHEIHESLDSSMSWCGLENGPFFSRFSGENELQNSTSNFSWHRKLDSWVWTWGKNAKTTHLNQGKTGDEPLFWAHHLWLQMPWHRPWAPRGGPLWITPRQSWPVENIPRGTCRGSTPWNCWVTWTGEALEVLLLLWAGVGKCPMTWVYWTSPKIVAI